MENKFKLVGIKFIDMHHFQMWEGKFKDMVDASANGFSEITLNGVFSVKNLL